MARKAMRGVLARGRHRFAAVATVTEAWDFLATNVKVDLVFLELKLEGESGLTLLQLLRANPFFKGMPVVIYTAAAERDLVQRALALKIQNFLVKPYRDEQILAEVAKTAANGWRARHFEEEKSFCTLMGYTPAGLRQMLGALRTELVAAEPRLRTQVETKLTSGAMDLLGELSSDAEAAGAWGVVDFVKGLRACAETEDWPALLQGIESLAIAERIIDCHLNPALVPLPFLSAEERNAEEEARIRRVWTEAPVQRRCPVVERGLVERQVAALPGCPIVDSIAASFQMSATGYPSSLAPLMDLAEKDPALSVQLLLSANQVRRREEQDLEPIENPRLSVGLLGELRLASLASGLITTEERMMHVPPCSWPNFRMFQIGVARMARYTCGYLEMPSLEPRAYTAGLVHDIGKLLLLHLYPVGFQVIAEYARERRLAFAAAEQFFLGCTSRDLAVQFCELHGLPRWYVSVMRWADDPAAATDDAELVAIVTLARNLCRQNRVGWSGSVGKDEIGSIADTPEWQVLRQRVFPSFNLQKFEAEAHAQCRAIKLELYGRMGG